MVRYLCLLWVALTVPILGIEYEGVDLGYAGLWIKCKYGCGDPDSRNMRKVYQIFDGIVRNVFPENRYYYLNDYKEHKWITPWVVEDLAYDVYDKKALKEISDESKRTTLYIDSYFEYQNTLSRLESDLHYFYVILPQATTSDLKTYLKKLKVGYAEGYRCFENDGDEIEFDHSYFGGDCSGNEIEYEMEFLRNQIKKLKTDFGENKYEEKKLLVLESLPEIEAIFKEIFVKCLENHQKEGIKFKTAIESFIIGEYEEGLEQILFLIDLAEKNNLENELISKLYLLKGQVQSEFCLYADAIVSLTRTIHKNPSLKESYLERAVAYFEIGEFDKAIEDFLESGFKRTLQNPSTFWKTSAEMSLGIILGINEGGAHSFSTFIPESLSTLRGLSKGLWAIVAHPIDSSNAFADAVVSCIEYLRLNSTADLLKEVVPELKELIENYDQLEDFKKGRLIGYVVGKYGVDILACKYSTKAAKMYLDLKKANQVMTLEALASPATTQKVLEEAGKFDKHRKSILKNGSLQVHTDRQGKHIIGHKNYDPNRKRSIWTYPEEKTEKLIQDFAGTGVKAKRATTDIPGMAGYQEIVNFGEIIGYDVNPSTGLVTPTSWGKVHYGKDGAHVVPCLPKE